MPKKLGDDAGNGARLRGHARRIPGGHRDRLGHRLQRHRDVLEWFRKLGSRLVGLDAFGARGPVNGTPNLGPSDPACHDPFDRLLGLQGGSGPHSPTGGTNVLHRFANT